MSDRQRTTAAARVDGRRRRAVMCVTGCLAIAGLFLGCGWTPAQRYSLLSFFVDGVPDPNALEVVEDGQDVGHHQPVHTVSTHEPYVEKNCDPCHSSAFGAQIRAPDSRVCRQCHEQVPAQYAVMHGPVAAEACLWCHVGHQSKLPHLLRKPDNELCTTCHQQESAIGPSPAHQDRTQPCLTCHSAHGSKYEHMLRDREPSERPAPPPTPNGVRALERTP